MGLDAWLAVSGAVFFQAVNALFWLGWRRGGVVYQSSQAMSSQLGGKRSHPEASAAGFFWVGNAVAWASTAAALDAVLPSSPVRDAVVTTCLAISSASAGLALIVWFWMPKPLVPHVWRGARGVLRARYEGVDVKD